MKNQDCKSLFIFVMFVGSAFILKAQQPLTAYHTKTPPVVDGILNDDVWTHAPAVSDFKTFIPDFGKNMSEKTIAYFANDGDNLYFAFKAFDRESDKIKSSVSSRDKIRADDWVCINLDSFNDQQSLYAIYCNPIGIQEDARYASSQEDNSFDMVFIVKEQLTRRDIRLRFKSLSKVCDSNMVMSSKWQCFLSGILAVTRNRVCFHPLILIKVTLFLIKCNRSILLV